MYEELATYSGDARMRTDETLLVHESPETDTLELALFIDEQALRANTVERLCLVTEGVSHLLLLLFRAQFGLSVSRLELELQAEVDKYVICLLQAAQQRAGALDVDLSREIRDILFGKLRLADGVEGKEAERYILATRLGARYVETLEASYVETGRLAAMPGALRRFYRLSWDAKLHAVSEPAKSS